RGLDQQKPSEARSIHEVSVRLRGPGLLRPQLAARRPALPADVLSPDGREPPATVRSATSPRANAGPDRPGPGMALPAARCDLGWDRAAHHGTRTPHGPGSPSTCPAAGRVRWRGGPGAHHTRSEA